MKLARERYNQLAGARRHFLDKAIEFSELTQNIINYISDHIQKNSGAALIIDYGKEGNVGATFHAVRQHKYSSPLK